MTLIAVDIDGTLGYRDRQEYMKTCNETLKLAIAEECLQQLSSLKAFYALPEVQSYKEKVGEAYYKKAIGWADFHPQVLRTTHLLPGAKEGVTLLATLGNVAYYTARYTAQSEELSQAMAQATLEWLELSDFVNPTNAVFCDGIAGKLRQLAQVVAGDPGPVILVDDQYTRLLERLTDLDEETARLLKRFLILVAFGTPTTPEGAPIPMIALPSWEQGAVREMLVCAARILTREQEETTTKETVLVKERSLRK